MKPLLLAAMLIASVGCSGQSAEQANARGKACLERKDYRCAVSEFGSAVGYQPSVNKYRFNLGLALTRTGALHQAESELQEVVRRDPNHPDARKLLRIVQANIEIQSANLIADQLRNH